MIFFIQIKAVNLAEKGLFTNLQLFSTVVFFRCSIKAYLSYFPIFRWSYIFLDEEWSSLILCIFCGFPFWLFYPLFSFSVEYLFLKVPLMVHPNFRVCQGSLTLKRVGGGWNLPEAALTACRCVLDGVRTVKPPCNFHFWCSKSF